MYKVLSVIFSIKGRVINNVIMLVIVCGGLLRLQGVENFLLIMILQFCYNVVFL